LTPQRQDDELLEWLVDYDDELFVAVDEAARVERSWNAAAATSGDP